MHELHRVGIGLAWLGQVGKCWATRHRHIQRRDQQSLQYERIVGVVGQQFVQCFLVSSQPVIPENWCYFAVAVSGVCPGEAQALFKMLQTSMELTVAEDDAQIQMQVRQAEAQVATQEGQVEAMPIERDQTASLLQV